MARRLFVTAIGTDVGKTIASAVLVEAMQADYWKPVQSGLEDGTDTDTIKRVVSNSKSVFHEEAYKLIAPMSPHQAAEKENIVIDPQTIQVPATENTLIIEGAGGLLVPITREFLMVDLIKQLNAEVVLVINHYLGSINHTMLSLKYLKEEGFNVAGLLYNGDRFEDNENLYREHFGFPVMGHIPQLSAVNQESIRTIAESIQINA